ncbi:MAG: protein N-lysine methyltransferase family protein [Desulfobulbaceae bacterium]|nr:protein N-lysine methyltransferase family protein [Desulfobulbaceae bacterium]
MDPKRLPKAEQALYHRLNKEYTTTFEPLRLKNDLCLNLLKVADLEKLLDGQDPLKDVSKFPFWVKLWESAIVLADFLANQDYKPGCTVLELGAGLGACGMAAAARGCDTVLSDYQEHILDFQRVSAAASGLHNVSFELLDWLNPPEMKPFDVVVGAEIIFNEQFNEPLLNVLRKSVKPDGVIYLTHDIKRKSLPEFLKLAEKEYEISASKRRLRSLEEDKYVLMNRLIPRKS